MKQLIDFGSGLWDMFSYIADFVSEPLLEWTFAGVTYDVTLVSLLLGGTVFAILTYKIIKFLIP